MPLTELHSSRVAGCGECKSVRRPVAPDVRGDGLSNPSSARRRSSARAPWRWHLQNSYANVTYFNEADKGGHFAAWEELCAAFGSLR
jgi:hypothetical protein